MSQNRYLQHQLSQQPTQNPPADDVRRELDTLLNRASHGDTDSIEELINRFQPLIQSYVKLALYGKVNYRDPIMVGFVQSYGKTAVDGAVTLRDRLARMDREDIEQEILDVFLDVIRKGVSNIQYAFRRDCMRRLAALARQNGRCTSLTELERLEQDGGPLHTGDKVLPSGDGGFGESTQLWVAGLTVEHPVFERMSESDRQLLVDAYLHRLDKHELKRKYGKDAMRRCKQLVTLLRESLFGPAPAPDEPHDA